MARRSTLLVTLDSLRADHCGYVDGRQADLTPTLTQLADDGVAYRQAVAPGPRTPSSVPVSFTGTFHQYRDGRDERGWQYRHRRLGEFMRRHGSLAASFRDRGFDTAAVTMNPWTTTETSFDQGFDEFVDLEAADRDLFADRPTLRVLDGVLESDLLEGRTPWSSQRYWFVQWEGVYPLIRDVLERLESPYFCWVFLLDCHLPYIAPRRLRTEGSTLGTLSHLYRYGRWKLRDAELTDRDAEALRRAYRDTVRSVDAFLDRLVTDVTERGDDPALVVHSDHGEGLGDHGTFSHERRLYEENLRVPLVVHDGRARATVDDPVSLKSLPTVLERVSGDDRPFDPRAVTQRFTLSQTEFGDRVALRGRRFKYVRTRDEERLYDLESDPTEREDLAAAAPEVRGELARLTDARMADQRERRAHYDAVAELQGG
jgi:arylsulfatase A-like enzyme